MAKDDEKPYIDYSPEELARIPPFEERDRAKAGGDAATLLGGMTGATGGAFLGAGLGAALGPVGAAVGFAAGAAAGGAAGANAGAPAADKPKE